MLSVLDHLTDMCMVMDRRLVINNEQPRLHAGCMNLFRHLMDEAQMTSERGYLTRSQCRSIWFHYNQLHQESKELNISMEDQLGWDPRENRTRAISSPVPLVGAQNRG